MRRFTAWHGHHGAEAAERIGRAWDGAGCLVLCPPSVEAPELGALETAAFPEEPVFGLFTTGTTRALPKLVFYSRRNVEASLAGILGFFDEARLSTVFCYPQPYHTFGLTLGYLLSRLRGYRLVVPEGRYGGEAHALRAGTADRGCLTLGTPTHFRDLLSYVEARNLELAPSYAAILGGATVDRALWCRVRDRLRVEAPSIGYGATEACPGVTHLPPGREPREDGEIGVPLPHLDVRVGPSEIEVRGASVCLATCEDGAISFPERLVLADRVERRDDGILVFAGRTALTLNRGGEKLGVERIEAIVREACGALAIAVGVPDPRLGEELGLVVEGRSARRPIYDPLEKTFQRRFDERNFLAVERLPADDSGKPDRKRAAALLERARRPVPVETLRASVPHRPPMVWIREVLWADDGEGECTVDLAASARGGRIQPSAAIEWIAQSYAFTQAARAGAEPPTAGRSAFLAGISAFALEPGARERLRTLGPESRIKVRVQRQRELGPLFLVEGTVTCDGKRLAGGVLKLYSGPAPGA